MSLWVKICGNTSLEDALLAAGAGADAVGFVFATSPRKVSSKQVSSFAGLLPDSLEKIGVFVDSTFEEIEATVVDCNLSGVQLHFDASPELPARLRRRFGPKLRILQVLHFGEDVAHQAAELTQTTDIDALLVDSRTPTAVGGTGHTFDWEQARNSLFRKPGTSCRLVVAGGLTPSNVEEAVETLCPWGVDVVSGVEASPGVKDPEKVRAFVANARAAAVKD
jgi:phosphoribosylanthranilate isomerase